MGSNRYCRGERTVVFTEKLLIRGEYMDLLQRCCGAIGSFTPKSRVMAHPSLFFNAGDVVFGTPVRDFLNLGGTPLCNFVLLHGKNAKKYRKNLDFCH